MLNKKNETHDQRRVQCTKGDAQVVMEYFRILCTRPRKCFCHVLGEGQKIDPYDPCAMNSPRLCGVGDPVSIPAAEFESVMYSDRSGNVEKRWRVFLGELSRE